MFSLTNYCLLILNRNFYTNNVKCKAQTGRFMKKVLNENKSRRKWVSGTASSVSNIPMPNNIAQGASEGKRSANSRRVAVLNKLFMRYITDIMATGNNASAFLGRGIEINRVKVTPDFKIVNVFWVAKGSESDDIIEALLAQNSGLLRHELSQLRVIGLVPKINFVKDKEYAKLVEVDLRLSKADFGEDYVPVEPSYKFKSELYLNTTLPLEIKDKIENLEEETIEEFEELPPMRMDLFGLNHADIMLKVQKSMKKSQASHRNTNNSLDNQLPSSVNEDPIEYRSYKEQKEAFNQFLLQRQIMQIKAKKLKEKYNPEYEYLRTEKIKYNDDTPFVKELKEEYDYIDEHEEDNKNL